MGSGLSHQLAQILRMLLDPESMQPNDKENFLEHIYTHHIQKLVDALAETDAKGNRHNPDARYHASELVRANPCLCAAGCCELLCATVSTAFFTFVLCAVVVMCCVGGCDGSGDGM